MRRAPRNTTRCRRRATLGQVDRGTHRPGTDTDASGWGPWEEGDAVKDAILEVGEAYDLRQAGIRTYFTNNLNGWVAAPLPTIYAEELKPFREWLPAESFVSMLCIGGSFRSDRLSDYYLTPFEVWYGGFIDYDHDFVGREALQAMKTKTTGRRSRSSGIRMTCSACSGSSSTRPRRSTWSCRVPTTR